MFSSSNPKFFAVRNIHYPLNTSSDHFDTDAVVPSSDHCRTQGILPPSCRYCIETVSPSGDHYCIDIVIIIIMLYYRLAEHICSAISPVTPLWLRHCASPTL